MRTFDGQYIYGESDATDDASSWNFIPPDTSGRSALTEDPELERYLVEEIARAKCRSPLMRRLAQVERENAAPAPAPPLGATAQQRRRPLPPPPSALASVRPGRTDLPMTAHTPKIEQHMSDRHMTDRQMEACDWDTPRFMSAEPPRNARRRAQRHIRLRTVLAWIATLAIGAAIAAIALPLQG